MSDGEHIPGTPPTRDESFPHPSLGRDPRTTEALLAPGTRIGHFRIERELGRGGMGIVYLARDTKLDRYVAIKSLPPEVKGNHPVRLRLKREATLLAMLNHPNIAAIYEELEEAEGVIYLVLEYVPGRSLAERITEGRVDWAETLSISRQIAAALAAAHEHGVIHRDLKPGNIMITPRSHVKVLDFGLAKTIDTDALDPPSQMTRPGRIMGTVAYMSPELARGEHADHRTDIWSLGVVMFEMLSGELPFRGSTQQAVIHSTLYEGPRRLGELCSGVPVAFEHMVSKMLQKEPSDRYESIGAFICELKLLERDSVMVQAASEEPASIAVLPFANMSPDKDQEYFCDGLAEELINALTQIKHLRVIARTSAFSYKGRNLNIRHIGRELNVETILEGSVRKAGDRLRVTAQLVDTRRDHHLWSERYDRQMGDVFSIQDEITTAIVNRLKPRFMGQEQARIAKRRPVDLEAYHLYLKGRYFRSKGTPGALSTALQYIQQAIEKDPNYAAAYAGLALSYSLLPIYSSSPPKQVIPKARELALRALQIDEMLPEAHGALGFIKTWYDWDWDGAQAEINRAIELNPGCDRFHLWHAHYLMLRGRHREALREIERALELDPISVLLNRELGMVLYYAREFDRAIETLKRTIEMDPSIMYAHFHLGVAYMQKSMYEEALREFQVEKEIARGSHTWAETLGGVVHTQMGQDRPAQEALDNLLERSRKEYVSPFHLACLCFGLRQDDAGFKWLNKAYEEQDHWLCFLKTIPLYDRICTDPRYTGLVEKIDLAR